MGRKSVYLTLSILAALILFVIVLSLPPVWSRVSYYSRDAYAKVKYWLNPPSEVVFVPSGSGVDPDVETAVAATLNAYARTHQIGRAHV